VIIAFDNFENLIVNSLSRLPINEDLIDEIKLAPIPEELDKDNKLNEPSIEKPTYKKDYVLYLENDDILDGFAADNQIDR
jgi:hypothetical protein